MNYSYTINVSPNKYVENLQWAKYTAQQQRDLFSKIINNIMGKLPFIEESEYVTELTKAGMVHVHGQIYTTEETIDKFQSMIHKKLGIPSLHPRIVCTVERTEVDNTHWVDYMNKDQDLQDVCIFTNYKKDIIDKK